MKTDNSDSSWLATVNGNDKERLTALMHVNDYAVRFQLDIGADVNTINKIFVKKDQVKAATQKSVMWNKSSLKTPRRNNSSSRKSQNREEE